jgi:hypothetical protein
MPQPFTVPDRAAPDITTTRTATVAVVLQFWGWAAILRPLKHVVPLRLLVRLVRGRHPASHRKPRREAAILDYMRSRERFPRRAPANCLERSLAAYRLLAAAGARPELHVGVRRGSEANRLEGHVWVVLDGQPAAEPAAVIATFTPVLRVDADGRIETQGHPASMPVVSALRSRSAS